MYWSYFVRDPFAPKISSRKIFRPENTDTVWRPTQMTLLPFYIPPTCLFHQMLYNNKMSMATRPVPPVAIATSSMDGEMFGDMTFFILT